IDLSRHAAKLAVAVPMQVVGALGHAVPGAERVMAEHQPDACELDLGIGLHARPFRHLHDVRTVIVADDKVLSCAVESRKQGAHGIRRGAPGEVPEVPHIVLLADRVVPAPDHRLVHFGNRFEGTLEPADGAAMTEMRVGGEPDGHGMITPTPATARWST